MAGRLRPALRVAGALAALLAAAIVAAAAMGLFAGERPADLGLHDGRLRGGDWRPNWVSSQAPPGDDRHAIAPFAISGEPAEAWARLERAILAEPGASLQSRRPGYLHAQFSSRVMGFVDDAEFALDARAGVIHVRSGARLGIRDFGVNRARLERLRQALR